MNPTLELIHNRSSLRIYADRPLGVEDKDAILQAAFRAPTAGGMMLYSILEIEDQALKERLAITCDNQPFIAKAPYVLVFLADYQRWFDYYLHSQVEDRCQELGKTFRTPQEGDLILACCDALIAAQTAVIAAESLGIGSCYIGDILENYEIHQELLGLPQYTLPVTMLCFGYPPENYTPRLRKRFEPRYIVHQNTYRRFSAEELEHMFDVFGGQAVTPSDANLGALNPGQANYFRKFIADFSIEMSRSVQAMIKNWK